MDFVDILLNRIDGESQQKKPGHALVCFTRLETGKRLNSLASSILLSRADKSSITLMYFIDNKEELMRKEQIEVYQNRILADFIPKGEKSKITMRLFISESGDYLSAIQNMEDEQHVNLLLIGLCPDEINIRTAEKYGQLMSDQPDTETAILSQFGEKETVMLKNVSALLNHNKVPTGIFLDNGLGETTRIFIPVLCKADMHIFAFVYQAAQKENVQIMVWDAVGIIQSEPKMQKLYQFIVKKSDGRVHLWDDNKKIEHDFIRHQDLVIIGFEGWRKLVGAPLPWRNELPSTLIIKEPSN